MSKVDKFVLFFGGVICAIAVFMGIAFWSSQPKQLYVSTGCINREETNFTNRLILDAARSCESGDFYYTVSSASNCRLSDDQIGEKITFEITCKDRP